MATVRRRRRVKRRDELTDGEFWDLMLDRKWREGSSFESPFLRKAAWLAHREELLEGHVGEGVRPGAWWEYDAPGQPLILTDGREEGHLAALVRLGEATPGEVRQFLREHALRFGSPQEREDLFRFHPDEKVRYEHEKRLIEALEKKGRMQK
ncbi:MAG: hypothetical protein QME79_07705 [Bacillota bacterium]|nr:hypothetical protein [Bacillota bacterium]